MNLLDRFRAWRKNNPCASISGFSKYVNGDARGRIFVGRSNVFEREKFRFVASIEPDDDSHPGDTDFYGSFTSEFDFPDTLKRRVKPRRNEHGFWRPQKGSDVRSVAAFLNASGVAKAEAYERALAAAYQQMARLEAYGESWSYVGVVVRAYAIDDDERRYELAYASLWGIESDSDRSYIDDTVKDLIAECERELETPSARARPPREQPVTGIW